MLYLLHLQKREQQSSQMQQQKHWQTKQSIGIYYDGAFVSVPNVQAAITNGQAQISGNMTYEEADALASTIRIGGLKLELEELRSNVVGAQLGEQAVATSLKAGAIGLAIVFVFMCCVYLLPGLASGLATFNLYRTCTCNPECI